MKKSKFNIIKKEDNNYLVFNTLTKAVARLTKEIGEYLINDEIDHIPPTIQNKMKESGFLISNDCDEIQVLKNNYEFVREKRTKVFLTLLPTMRCNFHCPYCFEGNESKNNLVSFDVERMKKFILKIISEGVGHLHITLFGGEPLLELSKLIDMFKYIKNLQNQYNFSYSSSIATNGYMLTNEVVNDLINICNIESFQITIDGYKESHNITRSLVNGKDTYNDVLKNFKNLLLFNDKDKYNILLRVNLLNNTLTNIESLLEEFADAEKKNFEIYFRPIYNTKEFHVFNNNLVDLEDYYRLAKNKGFKVHYGKYLRFWHCEGDGGIEQLHIMPNMEVWKCINDITFLDAKLGYIEENGNLYVNNEKLQKWLDTKVFSDSNCLSCKMLPICWGGCPLYFLKTGKRSCIYEKEFDYISTFFAK